MREISFDFHRMESICDELALFSDMFTKQVLGPLHNAYSVLDPEISSKVKTRFHVVMERASYLRGEQNNLAALIDYASNAYKKYDREAVNNLVEINEQAHHMLDGIQQELSGVAHGHSANTSGAFALMPDGYSRDLPHTSLRELGKVASFVVKEDQVDYSFTATALSENQATTYDAASPLHHFAFPKFDFHNEKMSGSAPNAGKFVVPAIVATGVGGAFYALHLQTRPSSGIEQKRVSSKKLASDSRVKTMTKVASKGALAVSLSTGGLAVLKNHAKITFTTRDKQSISANNVLPDAGEAGLPVRADDRRVIYDSLAALGFFTFGILVLPKFIHIENFRIIVDTVSRDIFLKDYYQCIRNRSLTIDAFSVEHSAEAPASARARLEDELAAAELKGKIDSQMKAPPRKETDELNAFIANNTDSQQEYPHRAIGQIHDLDDFAAQNGVTTPISARARLDDELSALNLQKADAQMKVPPRIETDELLPWIFQEKLDTQIVVPPSYDTEPLMRVVFPDGGDIPWTFLLKYDPNFTTWMERFDIRVRILPPDYRYIREFIPLADDDRAVMHKDMLAVGKLAGFGAQESDDAAVVGNTNRISVKELDQVAIISETSDILWKHLLYRDTDISELQMKKDWTEILGGKFFTAAEFDARDQYERNLYDSVFAFLVKSVYVPELQKLNVSAASHTSAVMGKVAMEEIENPTYVSYTGNIASPKKIETEEVQTSSYQSGKSQVSASKATVYVPELQNLNASMASHTSAVMGKVAMEEIENPAYLSYTGNIASPKKIDIEEMWTYSSYQSGKSQVSAPKATTAVEPLEETAIANAGADEALHVTANRVETAELTADGIGESIGGSSVFGVNRVQAADVDAVYGAVLPVMAKASGARVDVSESELTSQFTRWNVNFVGNTYKGNTLSNLQSASAYLGAKTGAKAVDVRELEPANGNSVNSVIINAKKTQELELDDTEISKNESTELTDQQIHAMLSALAGATIGTGLVFAAKKAAGALRNGGSYSLPEHVSFESLQKSAVAITGEMLISLAKYGVELGSIATLVDTVCKSVWTQGSAVSAVITYSSVALLSAHKIYNIYKG